MWLTLAALIVCFTIIVLFRMYIDLRRQDQQHIRLTQSDQRNHEKYLRVTKQEAISEMTKVLEDLKQGKYVLEPDRPTPAIEQPAEPIMIEYKKARLDPALMTGKQVEWLQEQQYQQFIMREQKLARERRAREQKRRTL